MTLQSDAALSQLNEFVERRKRVFRQQVPQRHRAIALRHSARGTLLTDQARDELRDAIREPFGQFAEGTVNDLLDALKGPDGTVSNDAATWIRQRLEPELASTVHSVVAELRGSEPHLDDVRPDLHAELPAMIAAARRQLAISIGRVTRSRRASATTLPPPDLASIDELVRLKNRRAFTADIARLFTEATTAEEPLALVRIDVDRFKQVNDLHGGHIIGDEALAAIARVLQACVRGKGEAYRVGGDEFILLLPNHSTDEATAVAERVRIAANVRPVTSRALTISLSMGVATYPEHAPDPATLEQAADQASYDAKNRGRNLVRVFGEPEPTHPEATRVVARKQPDPTGLTEQQKDTIRADYFRHGVARCPHDEAILKVTDLSTVENAIYRINVACPLCGLTAQLPD